MAAIDITRQGESILWRLRRGPWLLAALLGLAATGPAYAINREVSVAAPISAVAGTRISVLVKASTDAGGGERIGFFHADYSVDNGTTWTAISYATNEGPATTHTATFKVGAAGSTTVVRVRVAFRGGKAGDVDFNGKGIEWQTTWNSWQAPPAKEFAIRIVAP
jgi:hypothetical protein